MEPLHFVALPIRLDLFSALPFKRKLDNHNVGKTMEDFHVGCLININDQNYFVRDHGEGDRVVFFCHGMPDDGELWQPIASKLVECGYRVIAPDNLGCGQSSKPEDDSRYTYERINEDIICILDELELEKVHFVSHDVGAGIGWDFAMNYPQRLKSFVTMTHGHPIRWAEESFTLEGARYNWYLYAGMMPLAEDHFLAGDGLLGETLLATHPNKDRVLEKLFLDGSIETYTKIDKVNSILDFMTVFANCNGNYSSLDMKKSQVPTYGISAS